MKNTIPKFLQEKLNLKGNAIATKFPLEIKEFMIKYDKFYFWNLDGDLKKIFKAMKQNISELPICGYESNLQLEETKNKIKETNLEKYGVENN